MQASPTAAIQNHSDSMAYLRDGSRSPTYRTIYSFPPCLSPSLSFFFSIFFPFSFSFVSSPPCFSVVFFLVSPSFYSFSPLQSFYFLSSILSLFYPQISPFVPLFRQPSTAIYSPREISTRIPRELGTREATKLADSDDWQIKFSVYRHDRKSEDR